MIMLRRALLFLITVTLFSALHAEQTFRFDVSSPVKSFKPMVRLKTNALPWLLTIPNLGAEFVIDKKWSVALDCYYCPWKLSDKFSVKTVALLPEARWWLKDTGKGSFFNLHVNVAWFNVRSGHYRYQDTGRPLLGAGLGYGYRLCFNKKWAMEFEIGAGVANMKYDRFHNVENGALKDTRMTTYWGIDRAVVAVTYNL